MRKRRVAFCISGQTRKWKYCYPMLKKLMDEFEIEPDIFIHTWDHNTEQSRLGSWEGRFTDHTIDTEMDDYINTLMPKKYKIDTHKKSMDCISSSEDKIRKYMPSITAPITVGWQGPQFYSMMYSSHLKQEYELENGFEYDLVFKFRNDLIVKDSDIDTIMNEKIIPNVLDDSTIFTVHSGTSTVAAAGFARFGDIFFIAPSRTYDMVCNFYRMIPYIYTQVFNAVIYSPEFYLAYYIKSLQLEFIDLDFDLKIARPKSYQVGLKKLGLEPYDCDIIIEENYK
jgi:hypothetical protein